MNAPLSMSTFSLASTPQLPYWAPMNGTQREVSLQQGSYSQLSDLFRDQVLSQFETQLSSSLNHPNTSYYTASSGINKAQIVYDGKTGNPVGILKRKNGLLRKWLYTASLGDIIAYKLDHKGFAGVMPAAEMETETGKEVIVKWIPHSRCNSYAESKTLDLNQRQAIAIFDMRVGNEDRNWCNIQIDNEGKLYPIDHDRIFYQYRQDNCSPFSSEPLSKRSARYISSLDINDDVKILRQYKVDENEIKNLVVRTTFLKLAARAPKSRKITLRDIEEVIEAGRLPTAGVTRFIQKWFYEHPWHKILNELEEPYSEEALLKAFEKEFETQINNAQNSRWVDLKSLICNAVDFFYQKG